MWRRTLRTAFKLSVLGVGALTLAEPALAQEGLFGGLRVATRPRSGGEDLHPSGRSFGHYDFAPPQRASDGNWYQPDPNSVPAMPPPKAKPARPTAPKVNSAPAVEKASVPAAPPAAIEPSAAATQPALPAPYAEPKAEIPDAAPVDIMLKVDGVETSAPEAKPQTQVKPQESAAPAEAPPVEAAASPTPSPRVPSSRAGSPSHRAAPAAAAPAQTEETAEKVAEVEDEPIRIRGRKGITLRY